jgi:AcrR family transcriptional regulator
MTKRPGRPGRPPTVSRDQVIDAAVRLAEQVGLDRFTMSQLAAELGVAQMTAYHHVGNRAALAGLVVERLLERVEIPDPDDGPWDAQLKALEASVRHQLGSVGGITTALGADLGAVSRRLADAVLAILDRAGFDESTALLAYGAMFTYMIGQLDLDLTTHDDATDPRFAELVAHRTGGRRPTPDQLFDFGFDLILTGLRHTLATPRSTPRSNPPGS